MGTIDQVNFEIGLNFVKEGFSLVMSFLKIISIIDTPLDLLSGQIYAILNFSESILEIFKSAIKIFTLFDKFPLAKKILNILKFDPRYILLLTSLTDCFQIIVGFVYIIDLRYIGGSPITI